MTVATAPAKHEFSIETASVKSYPKYTEILPLVARDLNKSLPSQLREIVQFNFGRGKLTTDEYYSLGLYDDRLSKAEKQEFVGLTKSRRIWSEINYFNSWIGLIDHKALFETMLTGLGYPTTRTICVLGGVSPGPRIPHLVDAKAFAEFLPSAKFPIFGKPVNSLQSIGSLRIHGCKGDELTLSGDRCVRVDQFANEVLTKFPDGYLLQEQLQQHPALAKLCGDSISTLRVVTVNRGNGPEIFRVVMKLVGGNNVADNFWRTGNLLAPVDLDSWQLGAAVDGMGFHAKWHEEHPISNGTIKGFQLPYPDEIQRTVLAAAEVLDTAHILGWDIALTPDGPVIIEANYTPDLIMLQVAHRRGVWDDIMRQTVEYAKKYRKQRHAADLAKIRSEGTVAFEELMKGVQRD